MKNIILTSFCIFSLASFAQVGIGTTTPNLSSALDISSTTKGFLPPRMTVEQRDLITNPATGLMIFNTSSNGQEVNIGTPDNPKWTVTSANLNWSKVGDADTDASTNFIGTTDDVDLIFKRNSIQSGILSNNITSFGASALANNYFIQSDGYGINNAAFGTNTLNNNTTGADNTGIGQYALNLNTVGTYNTAIGSFALYSNTGEGNTATGAYTMNQKTTGSYNVADGYNALGGLLSGDENTAIGSNTFFFLQNGSGNTAVGKSALSAVVGYNANNNTALGAYSGISNITANNATAVGYGAKVDLSNKVRIGNDAVTAIDVAGQLKVNAQGSNSYTLPATRGTSRQFLITDGTGGSSWVSNVSTAIRSFNGNIADSDHTVLATGDVNLPTPSASNSGRIYVIVLKTSAITVNGTLSDFGSGGTFSTYGLNFNNGGSKGLTVQSTGSAWQITNLVKN